MIKNIKKIVIIFLMLFWSFIVTGQDGCGGASVVNQTVGNAINNVDGGGDINYLTPTAIEKMKTTLQKAGVTVDENSNLDIHDDPKIYTYYTAHSIYRNSFDRFEKTLPGMKDALIKADFKLNFVTRSNTNSRYKETCKTAKAFADPSNNTVNFCPDGMQVSSEQFESISYHEIYHLIDFSIVADNTPEKKRISELMLNANGLWMTTIEACSKAQNPDGINNTLEWGGRYCPNIGKMVPESYGQPLFYEPKAKIYGLSNMTEYIAVTGSNIGYSNPVDSDTKKIHMELLQKFITNVNNKSLSNNKKTDTPSYAKLMHNNMLNNVEFFIPGMSEENILLYAQADIENVFTIKNNKVYFFKSASPEIHSNYAICSNGIVEQIVLNSDSDINQNISTIISLYGQPSRMGYSYSSQSYKVYIFCNKGLLYVCDENDNIIQKHLFKKFDNINDFDKKYGNFFPDENPYIY